MKNKALLILYIFLAICVITVAVLIISLLDSKPTSVDTGETDTQAFIEYHDGIGMRVSADDNEKLPFDVRAFFDENDCGWFFLPAEVDITRLTYRIYDEEGREIKSFTDSFTSGKTKKISFGENKITVGVMQTDLPSVCLTLGNESPSLSEITSDKYKSIVGSGDMSVFAPEELAAKYGCKSVFHSEEADGGSSGTITLKGRGHSSWLYADKKGFTVKLEESASILGMSKAKSWALIANHFDRSLIRNMIIADISESLGFYTEYRCVELYVDGEYLGTYTLTGKIKIDDKRINITDLEKQNEKIANEDYPPKKSRTVELDCGATVKYWEDLESPEDVTGGYLIEVDITSRAKKSESYVITSHGISYVIASPEYISYDEGVYIAEFLQDFEDAIYSPAGKNEKGRTISDYADIKTLALRYLVDEMCRNPDGGETSTFFYKDSDSVNGILYSGPLWDYDLAFGNYSGYRNIEGYETRNRFYYPELFKKREFTDALLQYYDKVKALYEEVIGEKADKFSAYLKTSADMNFKRWDCLNRTIKVAPADAAKSYTQARDYVKNFLKKRIKWLDDNLYKELKSK